MVRILIAGLAGSARGLGVCTGAAGMVVAGAGSAILHVEHAQAQPAGMMAMQFSEYGIPIGRRSVEEYAKLLGMTDDQKDAAMLLLDGYREAHKAATSELQAKMEDLQRKAMDTQDWQGMMKEMPAVGRAARDKLDKTEKTFMEDLKATLTSEQQEKFAAVERHRRRDISMRFSLFSGSTVDIIRIMNRRGVEGADVPEVAQLLSQYEAELDRKLVEGGRKAAEMRDIQLKDSDDNIMARQSESMKMLEDLGKHAKEVRDLNKDFARRIESALPEGQREKFMTEFNRRAFPRIWGESHIEKQLNAAVGFSDIDQSQKDLISSLREQYQRDARALNSRWATARERAEDAAGGSVQLMMAAWQGGSDDLKKAQDEVKEARDARDELDKRIQGRLKEILKKEQADRLPSREPSNQENMWGMEDMFDLSDEDVE